MATTFDKYRLFSIMNKLGITQAELCNDIKMSRSAFSKKCNGKSEFTWGEIVKICERLGLETPMGIFFVEKVS